MAHRRYGVVLAPAAQRELAKLSAEIQRRRGDPLSQPTLTPVAFAEKWRGDLDRIEIRTCRMSVPEVSLAGG